MKFLTWTRVPDGEHNGRPRYEYHATAHDRTYHIVWAYDRGGSFGYSARNKEGPLTERHGIVWAKTLVNCKAACEQIERTHVNGK